MTNQSFAALLDESLAKIDLRSGAVITATVIYVAKDIVVVSAGLKSESIIPAEQFHNEKGELDVNVGDEVEVTVESVEDGNGETRLSREKARRAEAWRTLEKLYKANETVRGTIIERVKGGFTVAINSVRAFLPGSLVDVRPVRDPGYLEGKELEFKLIKMDQKRNNIVVSRRAVVEQESVAERQALLDNLQEGQVVKGIVKNITDYGAFIDLGGIDGLLHITDMAWKRVKHPAEMLNVGDEIKVVILKFDPDKKRVSLGIKQLAGDPWVDVKRRYPVGTRLFGKVTNLTDYGCFVQLEEGIEGLVHMSEMDWTNKNIHPAKIVHLGDEVEVMVLDLDEERRRISLGIKQCQSNPWEDFATAHKKDEKIAGNIRSITDFGIFVGLDGGIDGLVHMSDISWTEPGEVAVRKYKKGQQIEALILAIDAERERISLGIKQLEQDPLTHFVEEHANDSIARGKISEIDAKRAIISLAEGVDGYLRASDFSREQIEDLREHLKMDEEVEARVIGIDRKNRAIQLSIKDLHASPASGKNASVGDAPINVTLGDLLKEQMESKNAQD